MTHSRTFRTFYRRHADYYPYFYNAQQRLAVLLRSRFNYVHERDFLALTLLGMAEDAYCIDVGGNRGQSITAIKSVLPRARVLSFEPNPVAYSVLTKVAKRYPGVITKQLALGELDSETAIYIPQCRGVIFDQLATTRVPDLSELTALVRDLGYTFARQATLSVERVLVTSKRLDWFGLSPDFIKIDVEGSELEVLLGARQTLIANRPALMIERGDRAEIESFLVAQGYRRYIFSGSALKVTGEQSLNHFYIHSCLR